MSLQFGLNSINIGKLAKNTSASSIAIGFNSSGTKNYGITIGYGTSNTADAVVLIGKGLSAGLASRMILAPCTTANTIIIGNANTTSTTIYGVAPYTAASIPVSTINFGGIFGNSTSYDTIQKCLDIFDDHTHTFTASSISPDTSAFTHTFSVSDTNVQLALDKIDNLNLRYRTTYNYAFGANAGIATSGSHNLFIGDSAGKSCTTNTYCIGIGYNALYTTSAKYGAYDGLNCAIGYNSLYALTTGTKNTCLGMDSGYAITTAGQNTVIGHSSGTSLTNQTGNVHVGSLSNCTLASTIYSVTLGYNAISTGSYGVAIGYNTSSSGGIVLGNTTTDYTYVIYQPFTKLGSDAFGIKVTNFTGTTPSSSTGSFYIYTDVQPSKIISLNVLIRHDISNDGWVPPCMGLLGAGYASYNYLAWANITNSTYSVYVKLDGAGVASKSYKITLIYSDT